MWMFCVLNCSTSRHYKSSIFYIGRPLFLSLFAFLPLLHSCITTHAYTKSLSLSLSLSLLCSFSLSFPSTSNLWCICMVPGCLEAVCICMGETVDRDGIWHAGTRSKRSIWSHKNRRKPSSHPYKTPTDSQLCQPWLLHLLSSPPAFFSPLSHFSLHPSMPRAHVKACLPACLPAWLCDYALW